MKTKVLIFLFVLFLPVYLNAQTDTTSHGINFQKGLSWEQLTSKAKSENKYIFLDCFATWCGPCKAMDKDIYNLQSIGVLVNDKYISMKIQLDSSNLDNDEVKNWYRKAHEFGTKYRIISVPTYLFFSPAGILVHRDVGYMDSVKFSVLVRDAVDSGKQYYTLMDKFHRGKLAFSDMSNLANFALRIRDRNHAEEISKYYIVHYLIQLPDKDFYTKNNIEFVSSFMESSKDEIFKKIYNHTEKIDSLMKSPGFAETIIKNIITREEINPLIWPNDVAVADLPNWKGITEKICKKYTCKYAHAVVLDAQLRWYTEKNDWAKIVKYNIEKVDRYGYDTSSLGRILLNNMIYGVIFLHSTNKADLEKGIKRMEDVLKIDSNDPEDIDTYANLLYKSGRKKEAIIWEKKALLIARQSKTVPKEIADDINKDFSKMEKNEPTW